LNQFEESSQQNEELKEKLEQTVEDMTGSHATEIEEI